MNKKAIRKNYHIVRERLKSQGLRISALWLYSRGFTWFSGVPILRHSRITPQIYVGPQFGRMGLHHLRKEHIHAVVNLRQEFDDARHGLLLEDYCYLPTEDDQAPSLEHIQQGIAFIKQQESCGKKVYIHCGGGIGRAPTMAAAYLISKGGILEDVLQLIRLTRPYINITSPQIERLKECQNLFHDANFSN